MEKTLTINIDGAARGNPGHAGIGILAKENGKPVFIVKKYIGKTTNNIAEYTALLIALEESISNNFNKIKIVSDSELVVRQVNRKYKVKDSKLKPLYEKAMFLIKKLDSFEIVHVKREENKEADKLANEAIDQSIK